MKQINLFNPKKYNNKKEPVHRFAPVIKHKYPLSRYSYRQRLIWLIRHKMDASTCKAIYKAMISPKKQPSLSSLLPKGRTFVSTVNRTNLNQAVQAMHQRKYGNYPLSINKIAKHFKVSKRTMYRAYNKKY